MNESDFPTFWLAAQALWQGQDPTRVVELHALAIANGIEPSLAIRYQSPPWSLALLLLFLPYSLPIASALNGLLNISWIGLSIGRLTPRITLDRKSLWLSAIFLATFSPLFDLFQTGQITGTVLLTACLGFLTRRRHPIFGGVLLSLSTIKLHLFFPLYAYLLGEALCNRNPKTLFGVLMGIGFQWAIVAYLSPAIAFSFRTNAVITDYLNPTLGAYLHFCTGMLWARFLPAAVVSVLLLVPTSWVEKRMPKGSVDDAELVAALLLLGICTAPYAWTYDFVALLPAIFILIATAEITLPSLLLLFCMNVLLLLLREDMALAVWYPLILLIMVSRQSLTPLLGSFWISSRSSIAGKYDK